MIVLLHHPTCELAARPAQPVLRSAESTATAWRRDRAFFYTSRPLGASCEPLGASSTPPNLSVLVANLSVLVSYVRTFQSLLPTSRCLSLTCLGAVYCLCPCCTLCPPTSASTTHVFCRRPHPPVTPRGRGQWQGPLCPAHRALILLPILPRPLHNSHRTPLQAAPASLTYPHGP